MTTGAPITQADALARFPDLAELVTLRELGWSFRLLGDGNQLVGIAATQSRAQCTDVLLVFDRTHVVASRLLADDYGGGVVWFKDGSDLTEVARDLLALPSPGEPGAPSLVIRADSLWTP